MSDTTVRRDLKVFEASADTKKTGKMVVPVGFKFVHRDTGEERVEEFETACVPGDSGTVLAISAIAGRDRATGQQLVDLQALMHFYHRVMPADDFQRFATLIDDPDWTIHLDLLSSAAKWLMEQYSGRPLGPSSGSSTRQLAPGPS